MRNRLLKILVTSCLFCVLAMPLLALAAPDFTSSASAVASKAGYDTETTVSLTNIIGEIINYVLSFLGVAAIIIIIIAGYMWMTAGGNDEKVSKAKSWIVNGIIGLTIILLAYAISNFVFSQVNSLTDSSGQTCSGNTPVKCFCGNDYMSCAESQSACDAVCEQSK
jgi:type IV secretory pathway VirB2 component (pilin)